MGCAPVQLTLKLEDQSKLGAGKLPKLRILTL
jgi:hypothetical protein